MRFTNRFQQETTYYGPRGCIHLIMGPMYCNKTTYLQYLIRRYQIANKRCVCIKFQGDQRYSTSDEIVTHDQRKIPALACVNLKRMWDHPLIQTAEVIGVDEGQFLKGLVWFCEKAANHGKVVIVSALNGDYRRHAFRRVAKLIPRCEFIDKQAAVCRGCNGEAHFTYRFSHEKEVEVIGSTDKYVSLCRECYMRRRIIDGNDDDDSGNDNDNDNNEIEMTPRRYSTRLQDKIRRMTAAAASKH